MGRSLLSTWLAMAREAAGREVLSPAHGSNPAQSCNTASRPHSCLAPRRGGGGGQGDMEELRQYTALTPPTHAHQR